MPGGEERRGEERKEEKGRKKGWEEDSCRIYMERRRLCMYVFYNEEKFILYEIVI